MPLTPVPILSASDLAPRSPLDIPRAPLGDRRLPRSSSPRASWRSRSSRLPYARLATPRPTAWSSPPSGRLLYGSDKEGGGPYAYPEPDAPRGMAGFEVELMERLAGDLGVEPVFSQGQWDKLLQVLDSGRIDVRRQRLRVDRAAGRATTWRPGRITSTSSS